MIIEGCARIGVAVLARAAQSRREAFRFLQGGPGASEGRLIDVMSIFSCCCEQGQSFLARGSGWRWQTGSNQQAGRAMETDVVEGQSASGRVCNKQWQTHQVRCAFFPTPDGPFDSQGPGCCNLQSSAVCRRTDGRGTRNRQGQASLSNLPAQLPGMYQVSP